MDSNFISLFNFFISMEFLLFAFIVFLLNHSIIFVPQNSVSLVERFRKFKTSYQPGLNFLFPFIDKVVVNRSLKEQLIHIPKQAALTKDNISVRAAGILHFKIINPYTATYSVEDHSFSLIQLAQATFQSEISKLKLYSSFDDLQFLNTNIIDSLNETTKSWGILVLGYDIKEISLPSGILNEMEDRLKTNMRAERAKQALIIKSEGHKQSTINIAEGKKQAKIIAAQANKVVNSLKSEVVSSDDTVEQNKVEVFFAQQH